jgi:hypothetical protein
VSHGWGSNSQWGTDFRRDYVTDEAYVYNVDGTIDLNQDSRIINVACRLVLHVILHRRTIAAAMTPGLPTIEQFLTQYGAAVLATLAESSGSSPREVGAGMVVRQAVIVASGNSHA